MTKPIENLPASVTTGLQPLALTQSNEIGRRLQEIGYGRPLPVSAALAGLNPSDTDQRLVVALQQCSGRSPALMTRTLFPNDGQAYSIVAEVRWDCPREKLAEVLSIIEGAFKAAPNDQIANELYKLRMLTAGRDQKDAADQEAENVIWLEQLRCYPGDIVIDVLRSWTKPGNPNGKWWPTWNDIAERLQRACDRRQALLNFVRQLATRPDPMPALTHEPESLERRKAAVERWEEMRKGFKETDPAKPQEAPEEALKRLAARKDDPVAIGGGLLKKIEEMKGAA